MTILRDSATPRQGRAHAVLYGTVRAMTRSKYYSDKSSLGRSASNAGNCPCTWAHCGYINGKSCSFVSSYSNIQCFHSPRPHCSPYSRSGKDHHHHGSAFHAPTRPNNEEPFGGSTASSISLFFCSALHQPAAIAIKALRAAVLRPKDCPFSSPINQHKAFLWGPFHKSTLKSIMSACVVTPETYAAWRYLETDDEELYEREEAEVARGEGELGLLLKGTKKVLPSLSRQASRFSSDQTRLQTSNGHRQSRNSNNTSNDCLNSSASLNDP